MPAIISDTFRIANAERFKNFAVSDTLYLAIGRSTPWDDDLNPPTPKDNTNTNSHVFWREMIGARRIIAANTLHAIKRYDWSSGTTYAQYDDQDGQLFTKNFHVLTQANRVYKCLWNNNGAASTEEPLSETATEELLADGYIWKYMFTLDANEIGFYLNPDFLPVKYLTSDDGSLQWTVQQDSVVNGIHTIKILTSGTGYTATTGLPTITITGDGTSATVPSDDTHIILGPNGEIESILVDAVGSGYTYATVTITGGDGSGATARPILSPSFGHGKNAIKELGAYYTISRVTLDPVEDLTGKLTTENDYRRISILRNPLEFGTTTAATGNFYRQTTVLDVSALPGGSVFAPDEIITNTTDTTSTGIVVEHDVANGLLYVTDVKGRFLEAEGIEGSVSGHTVVLGPIVSSELEPQSGDFIYTEQRKNINRSDTQIEDIKIVIEH